MFDTLTFVKELEAGGFDRNLAETQVKVFAKMISANIATKKDLEVLELRTNNRFDKLEAEMASEFAAVRSEMDVGFAALDSKLTREISRVDGRITSLEHRLTIKLGSMIAASSVLIVGALTILIK